MRLFRGVYVQKRVINRFQLSEKSRRTKGAVSPRIVSYVYEMNWKVYCC